MKKVQNADNFKLDSLQGKDEKIQISSWSEIWNKSYKGLYLDEKSWEIIGRYLPDMFDEGRIGNIILDVGCGKFPISDALQNKNCKRVLLDITGGEFKEYKVLKLEFDVGLAIDNICRQYASQVQTLLGFLEISDCDKIHFDTLIFSQILNYIDYKQLIIKLSKFQKDGDTLLVCNQAGCTFTEKSWTGDLELTSQLGVKQHKELVDFLASKGYKAEGPIACLTPKGYGVPCLVDETKKIQIFRLSK